MKPRKKVHGVGVNDSGQAVVKYETTEVNGVQKQKRIWTCPHYSAWLSMLTRCYSEKYQQQRPTYKGCSVSDDWLTFSNFRNWMETQDWEGLHLDKDILIEGNKIYSAETCVFVTQTVNSFTNDHGSSRGEWLIGVSWRKDINKFRSMCSNPITKKHENLGLFTNELQAHQAWLKRKLELAHELAAIQTDPRISKALIDRYSKPWISD